MDRLLEMLRRNPDAIAIAALCLLFGFGRSTAAAHGTMFERSGRVGVYRIWERSAEGASCALRSQLNDCLEDLPELFSFPEFER